MSNRHRIIVTALGLSNEQGTAAVSTNHIAAACGIRPGNLYYLSRNIEEIIRSLFEQLFAAWDHIYGVPGDRPPHWTICSRSAAPASPCSGTTASSTAS